MHRNFELKYKERQENVAPFLCQWRENIHLEAKDSYLLNNLIPTVLY